MNNAICEYEKRLKELEIISLRLEEKKYKAKYKLKDYKQRIHKYILNKEDDGTLRELERQIETYADIFENFSKDEEYLTLHCIKYLNDRMMDDLSVPMRDLIKKYLDEFARKA